MLETVTRRLQTGEFGLLRELRLAALADSPEMFNQSLEEAQSLSDADWISRSERYAAGTEAICCVAEHGVRAVGMTFAFLDKNRREVVRVGGMWVASDARRNGVGAALLSRVREWAVERGRTELRLHVFHRGLGAQAFYRSERFEPATAEPDQAGFVEFFAPISHS